MELVEGKSLREILEKAPLPNKEILHISSQTAEGLAKAHGAGIVHRDLKPENVMVSEDGYVKIMDFGLAKLMVSTETADSEMATLAKEGTRPGVVMGTVGYMSPEQASGRQVDHRSDQFALGAMLYEMATGKRAFQKETAPETLTAILREETASITETNPDVPPPFRWIVERCLSKKPEERYESTGDLARELKNVREHLKEVSTGPTTIAPPKTPRKRLWVTAAVVLLIIVGALGYFLTRPKSPGFDPKRVAVAVFENQTGDPSLDSIGRMAADWITQGLTHTEAVSVVPASTVFSTTGYLEEDFRGEALLRALAIETKAGTVVSGTYYRDGETLRFQSQITDVESDQVVTAIEPVSGPADEPMETIEELRQRIMGAVALVFGYEFDWAALMSKPPSFEAYQLHVRAGDLFLRGDFEAAIEQISQITEIEPSWLGPQLVNAAAHGNLGRYAEAEETANRINASRNKLTTYERFWLDWLLVRYKENRSDTLRASRKWLEAYPSNFQFYQFGLEAYRNNRLDESINAFSSINWESEYVKSWQPSWYYLSVVLHLKAEYNNELEESLKERELFPGSIDALWDESRALAALGRISEVRELLDESLRFSPDTGGGTQGRLFYRTALELRAHGHPEAAADAIDKALRWFRERSPKEAQTERNRDYFGRALYVAERWDEAQELFRALHDEFPDNIDYQGYLGVMAVKQGDLDNARQIQEELRQMSRPYLFGRHLHWAACIAAQLGEKEEAVNLLREAFSRGRPYTIEYHRNVILEPLHDYPPYQELMAPK
jgi:tetratricopeptide (TPR) repeat protein